MRKLFHQRSAKSGLPPGTPVHVGEKRAQQTRVVVIEYDEAHANERVVEPGQIAALSPDGSGVVWVNVDGLHQVEVVEQVCERFGLHPLVIEDILHTDQRPKIEDYGEYLFIVLKSLYHIDEESGDPVVEQISLVLGPHFLLSFQEQEGDEFDPARERVRSNKGRLRKMGADYMAYTLIDLIVDRYFVILEQLGDRMEDLEEKLVTNPATETLQVIQHLKQEMVFLRKSTWPLREVVGSLERRESPLIQETTQVYLRDVYDHVIQVIDAVETYRDMLSGMLDIYLSSVSNRMNEVMKVLTVIATIFIPLTFIVGLYGMNFQFMPELKWRLGYPMVWLVMIGVVVVMVAYFRRRRWM
jgi:magnesium transporter